MELFLRQPKILATREIKIKNEIIRDIYEGEVPKEMSDYSAQVIGNGQARIAVSTDMGFKDFGNGVSVSVTLSLSCNQDDTTINNVVQALGGWSREYCKQQVALANEEYQKLSFAKNEGQATLPSWKPT